MIPVTTIGGYLGAGKTTLINHLLRHAGGERLAVLVNEFGELSIDEDLIEATGDDIISIAGGCICCSFGDNLMGAMMDMAALTPPPDHIVIEASGVAIPGSVAASLSLLQGFRQDGIVVLADAETIRGQAIDKYVGDTILRQLQDADLVIVTKTDLVDDKSLQDLHHWIKTIAPNAQSINAINGNVAPDIALGPHPARDISRTQHSDRLFDSVSLKNITSKDANTLARTLASDPGIIRAKGIVTDPAGRHVVQIVGARAGITTASEKMSDEFVCIGLAGIFDAQATRQLLQPGS